MDDESWTQTQAQIGERLREQRQSADLTQSELAERADVPQHRISEYERSRRAPSLRSVYRLADAIGCTVHDLLPAAPVGPAE